MKRLILLLLTFAMLLGSLASCGGDGGEGATTTSHTKKQGSEGVTTRDPMGEVTTQGNATDDPTATTEPVTEPVRDPSLVTELGLNKKAGVMFTDESLTFTVTAKNYLGKDMSQGFEVSLSDMTVAAVAVEGNTLNVTPKQPGRTKITVSAPNAAPAEAWVTVVRYDATQASGSFSDEPEKIANVTVYDRALIENPSLSQTNAEKYAAVIAEYGKLYPTAKVSYLIAPKHAMLYYDDPAFNGKLTDEPAMIEAMYAYCDKSINCVNAYTPILENADDYMYYNSDHHWSPFAAYLAYRAYCESMGLSCAPLTDYKSELRNSYYQGTLYTFTKDKRAKMIYDNLYLFTYPNKTVSMTVTYADNGGNRTFSSVFIPKYTNYLANIGGDNPKTVITVAENDPAKCILVLKDSFGCSFVPFLVEHYGTIVVVDPRYLENTVQEELQDYTFTDILFICNPFNVSSASWVGHCNRIIGDIVK